MNIYWCLRLLGAVARAGEKNTTWLVLDLEEKVMS